MTQTHTQARPQGDVAEFFGSRQAQTRQDEDAMTMKSYVIEVNGTGETMENYCDSDESAEVWAEDVLEQRGYDPVDLVSGDWDADGTTDDGEQRWRKLYWASEEDAANDDGANAIFQICK